MRDRSPAAIAAGLVTGCFVTWNVTNVGAVADPLARTYSVSLAAVGLLTTALFVTHVASQLPAGLCADRYGARTVAIAACLAAVAGNALLLTSDAFPVGLAGRLVVGLGSGAGFVSGLDLVRAGGGGPRLHGAFGAATMTGGGLALMILPSLTDNTSWRAPYATGLVLAAAALVPLALVGGLPRAGRRSASVVRDRRLLPLGALQAATFGLAVVAGNWVVSLLERQGTSSGLAGVAGSTVLFAGLVTRPWGGALAHRAVGGRRIVGFSLVAVAMGSVALAARGPLWLSALGAIVMGLAAGVPFALVFAVAQRLRPDAPAAAMSLVNMCGVLAILVGTPLAGLTFGLPGDGALAFAAIAVLALGATVFLGALPARAAEVPASGGRVAGSRY